MGASIGNLCVGQCGDNREPISIIKAEVSLPFLSLPCDCLVSELSLNPKYKFGICHMPFCKVTRGFLWLRVILCDEKNAPQEADMVAKEKFLAFVIVLVFYCCCNYLLS